MFGALTYMFIVTGGSAGISGLNESVDFYETNKTSFLAPFTSAVAGAAVVYNLVYALLLLGLVWEIRKYLLTLTYKKEKILVVLSFFLLFLILLLIF